MNDTELFNTLIDYSWDLRCLKVPTGGGDFNIQWVIIEHHQREPKGRELGRAYGDDPREAIRDALRNKHRHPDCYNGCSFSNEVNMPEYSCAGGCQYLTI